MALSAVFLGYDEVDAANFGFGGEINTFDKCFFFEKLADRGGEVDALRVRPLTRLVEGGERPTMLMVSMESIHWFWKQIAS